MRIMYKPNISRTNRVTSTFIGAAIAMIGARRSDRLMSLAGAGLVARGVSGWCPVSAATGRNTATNDTKRALAGRRGVILEDAILIYRPTDEVYRYWRQLDNLPRFMSHLVDVREASRGRSHWVARGPMGMRVEWDAEIISDVPGNLISWKTVGHSDVVSAGSVRFKRIGDYGTEVQVKLQYQLPAGKVGNVVAELLGEDPRHEIAEDLRRFKELLEGGERSAADRTRGTSSSGTSDRGYGDYGSVSEPIETSH
jgi:uncharacterized membrane protein